MESVCFVFLNRFSTVLFLSRVPVLFLRRLPPAAAHLARGLRPQPPSLSVPCNRLWRLSCASRSSSSTLGGLPEERNTFTGCRHDDLEWAVAVAFSRPELAAASHSSNLPRSPPGRVLGSWRRDKMRGQGCWSKPWAP